jgi:type I restriction enzyme R subunit
MSKESEAQTRKSRVDPRLKSAGWFVTPFRGAASVDLPHSAVEEFPTDNGPADYALCDDLRIRAVAEAKKLSLGPQGVLVQAERYSSGVDQEPRYQGEYGVPFLYSTNGEEIWFHDIRHELNRSRRISHFHTPAALAELMTRETEDEFERLMSLGWSSLLRPYQVEAGTASNKQCAIASARCCSPWPQGRAKR